MGRFDYIAYDTKANAMQAAVKIRAQELEVVLNQLADGRAKALALTKLEEVYMWAGKAIRDEQIARGAPTPLQESRVNS